MPKYPHVTHRVARIPGAVFEKYRYKMKPHGSDLIRLHIGDTYMKPKFDLPLSDQFTTRYPEFNRYCDTFGIPPLREALAEKLRSDNGLDVDASHILVTCGATNALSAAMMTVAEPGEKILVLTPAWPIIRGIIRLAGLEEVEVPVYMRLYREPGTDVVNLLSDSVTDDTVGIYLNSPNNPSGKVLSRDQLEQIARFAASRDLWILSDESYDGLTYDGHEHISIGSFRSAIERSISVFTFSKIYRFAGIRLGYAVASPDLIEKINRSMVHQIYSPATFSQEMMIRPVMERHRWIPQVRREFQDLRDQLVTGLKIRCDIPEATYFVFFSLDETAFRGNTAEFIDRCFDVGVSVAPGEDFGKDFNRYIRLCFTGEPPDVLAEGIAKLNRIFDSG